MTKKDSVSISEEFEPPGCIFSPEKLKGSRVLAKKNFTIDLATCLIKDKPNGPTTKFRRRFYPDVTNDQWNDWRWQLRHRIQDQKGLQRIIRLSEDELLGTRSHTGSHPISITPYFAGLLDEENPMQAIRRSVVPVCAEFIRNPGESDDPLKEDSHSPVPGIVHRYPDRVLFLVTNFCSTYCRYCTRSRMIGNASKFHLNTTYWNNAIAYIENNSSIRDVLLSGGDPLTLSDERLEWLLSRLRRIPHVELLRIGTKVPVVLPQRITEPLVHMLRRYHPLWISIHVIHPEEITEEMSQACIRLVDAGIPLGSQTVLLSSVNDDVEIMKRLFHGLLRIRVKPYYLYQCDPVSGSAHFRTPVEKGLEIIQGLRGFTSGYAVPTYVIDAPGGGGKIPLFPESVIGRDGDALLLKNYEGKIYCYPDHRGTSGSKSQTIR